MRATRQLAHLAVLGTWAILGVWFTLRCLVGSGEHLNALAGLSYWLWFGGLAALTSSLVGRVEGPIGALGVHAALFIALSLLPQALPLSLLRLGLDLLRRA